jgi:hypothetical protein
MAIFFSDFFDVSADIIDNYGAFNISLINDLPLFVDPFLLFNSEKPIYQELHEEIIKYMCFLKEVSLHGTINPHLVDVWFTFPEVKQNWLGYSKSGNGGHGLGPKFARALNQNLNSIFNNFGEETITRSSHLEKLCLVREGVGRDNISDFTTNLIKSYLASYTHEFAKKYLAKEHIKKVSIAKSKFNYQTRCWSSELFELPYINHDYVILTPKDILTKDESWINKNDLIERFQEIADGMPNEILRAQVNEYFLRHLPRGSDVRKIDIQSCVSRAIDKFPEVIDYYIREKEDEGNEAISVSQEKVSEIKLKFVENISNLVNNLLLPEGFYNNPGNTYEEAKNRVLFLKDIIENKDGYRIFYVKGDPIEREEDLQIMYRLTWYATFSDINREVNNGRGPVDFKISRGVKDKILVEFKLAKNTKLKQNLEKQCEVYEKANDPTHESLKVIIYFSESELIKTQKIMKELKLADAPNIILIDARKNNKISGSKA